MSTIIKHPDGLTGSAVGLNFVDGVAQVPQLSKVAREILKEHGYQFQEVKDQQKPVDPKTEQKTDPDQSNPEEEGSDEGTESDANADEADADADQKSAETAPEEAKK